MPELAPDSVEVVELARGKAYVVVRARGADVVVLDRQGRLVRSPQRLLAIGRHVLALQQVTRGFEEAKLAQRASDVERSRVLLSELAPRVRGQRAARLEAVLDALASLAAALEAARAHAPASGTAPPTQRTLRRSVQLLNEAAAADRAAVRAVRELGGVLCLGSPAPPRDKLLRWVLARLSSSDLPFFMQELAAVDQELYAASFAKLARS
jgi:hypothetical protein